MYDRRTHCPAPYSSLQKSQFLNCYVSSSLKQISTKLHIFAKFSIMMNLRMDPFFLLFHLKISDILKRDVFRKMAIRGQLHAKKAIQVHLKPSVGFLKANLDSDGILDLVTYRPIEFCPV